MRQTIAITILSLASVCMMYGAGSFEHLMTKSIQYFQNTTRGEYSIQVGIKDAQGMPLHTESMHFYKKGGNQCIITSNTIMICQAGRVLSILPNEKVMVLHSKADSFEYQYSRQLFKLLENWRQMPIKELSTVDGLRVFEIEMQNHDDFEKVQIRFHKDTEVLASSTLWLNGAYMLNNAAVESPQIDISYQSLKNKEARKLSISDYLTDDLKPRAAYTTYTFHNTLEN